MRDPDDHDDDATDRSISAIREIPRENLFQSIQPRPGFFG